MTKIENEVELSSRSDIRKFILDIEKSFPVNNWKIDSVHLWPFFRMSLYLYLVHFKEKGNEERSSLVKSDSFFKKMWKTAHTILTIIPYALKYKFWLSKLEQKEFLFVENDAHKDTIDGRRFNRFFDSLISEHNIESKSVFLEYGNSTKLISFNKDLQIKYSKGHQYFKSYWYLMTKLRLLSSSYQTNLAQFDDFINHLNSISQTKKFADRHARGNILSDGIVKNLFFFNNILDRVQPKKIMILCYYSSEIMSLTAAANKANIATYEMQHGPQSSEHLAYSSWSNVPEGGYHAIPRNFWCWDKYSKKTFSNWIDENEQSIYASFVGGNPWIDYWKTKKNDFEFKNYILYSLQPQVLSLDELFPQGIINSIKSKRYQWLIRLHPRQHDEKDEIIGFLQRKNIYELVEIEKATNNPLPIVLAHSLVHITHFSGTAIEASIMGKHSVIINELGKSVFEKLIKQEKIAHYISFQDDNFEEKFNELIQTKLLVEKIFFQQKDEEQINRFLKI